MKEREELLMWKKEILEKVNKEVRRDELPETKEKKEVDT